MLAKEGGGHGVPPLQIRTLERRLHPHRVHFGVAVGEISGEDMKNPSERPGRTDPGNTCNEQPNDSTDDSSVIDLAYAGDQEAKYTGNVWIAHNSPLL